MFLRNVWTLRYFLALVQQIIGCFDWLQLSKSLKTTSMDVSAEIRSARKKSRDKVKSVPDGDVADEEGEEGGVLEQVDVGSSVEGAVGLRALHGTYVC